MHEQSQRRHEVPRGGVKDQELLPMATEREALYDKENDLDKYLVMVLINAVCCLFCIHKLGHKVHTYEYSFVYLCTY